MNPDLKKAATKAIRTIINYRIDPKHIDPLCVLKMIPNVLLLPYTANEIDTQSHFHRVYGENQDAFTLVNRGSNGKLQYIIVYNKNVSSFQLKLALARELGHIILEHDGTKPEHVWDEEANCFAHHFLCPLPLTNNISEANQFNMKKAVRFRPVRKSLLWEMKGVCIFDNLNDMKAHVVEEYNKYNQFIGNNSVSYEPDDVELLEDSDFDNRTGWKNNYDVVLDGKTVGYCGE